MFSRTADYVVECGYDTDVKPYSETASNAPVNSTLIVTDSSEAAARLSEIGYYCVGVLHRGNDGEDFKGLKFIFEELEEVDMDSFVKAYQRYAGEPWEVIRTDRLLIRETTIEDIDEFYRIYADPDMTRYMEGLFEDPEDEKRYQKDYIDKVYGLLGFGVWTIIRACDNTIIGRAGYSVRNGFDEIELGFLIGKEYQHQGYAYEACSAILDYGKNLLLLVKVQALVKKENLVSIHLCEKLGFTQTEEVSVEENIYSHGYHADHTVTVEKAQFGTYIKFSKTL